MNISPVAGSFASRASVPFTLLLLCCLPSFVSFLLHFMFFMPRVTEPSQGERREDPFEDSSSLRPPLFLDIAPISLSLSVGRRPTKGQGDAKIRPVVLGRLVEMNWKNSPAKDVLGLFVLGLNMTPAVAADIKLKRGKGERGRGKKKWLLPPPPDMDIDQRKGRERNRIKEILHAFSLQPPRKEGRKEGKKEGLHLSLEHLSKRDAASTETSFSMQ